MLHGHFIRKYYFWRWEVLLLALAYFPDRFYSQGLFSFFCPFGGEKKNKCVEGQEVEKERDVCFWSSVPMQRSEMLQTGCQLQDSELHLLCTWLPPMPELPLRVWSLIPRLPGLQQGFLQRFSISRQLHHWEFN